MEFTIHHKVHIEQLSEVVHILKTLNHTGERIVANQAQLAQQLNDVTATLNKIATEENTLQTKIADLIAQLANADVSPELQASADALVLQAKVVDDIVPDPVV